MPKTDDAYLRDGAWPREGTPLFFFRLAGGINSCKAYAAAKHSHWVENNKIFPVFYSKVFWPLVLIGLGIVWLKLISAGTVISSLTVFALAIGAYFVWSRIWFWVVAANVVTKPCGDMIIAVSNGATVSWPNRCVGCNKPDPAEEAIWKEVRRYHFGNQIQIETTKLKVPICSDCYGKADRIEMFFRSANAHISRWFHGGLTYFQFTNYGFGSAFHFVNPGSQYLCSECSCFVLDILDNCPGCGFPQPRPSLKESSARV